MSERSGGLRLVGSVVYVCGAPHSGSTRVILKIGRCASHPGSLLKISLNAIGTGRLSRSSVRDMFRVESMRVRPFPIFEARIVRCRQGAFTVVAVPYGGRIKPYEIVGDGCSTLGDSHGVLCFHHKADGSRAGGASWICQVVR